MRHVLFIENHEVKLDKLSWEEIFKSGIQLLPCDKMMEIS